LTLLGLRTDAKLDNTSVSSNPNNYREEDIFSLRLDYAPEEGPQFFLKSYYHDWDSNWVEPGAVPEFWGYDDFGLSFATLLAPGENVEYQLGYDFQTYEGQDDVLLIAKQREDVHAVFGQVRTTDALLENAALSFGVRHDRTGGSDSTVWSASGIYHFNDYLYLQGVAGTTFLLPSAENLYRIHCPNPGVSTCTHGNPNLEPEESVGVNVSIGGRIDVAERPMSWQVTTWDRRIDNLITTAPIDPAMPNPLPPEFSRTFINVPTEVKATGYELLFRGPITEAVAFDVSYTYSKERTASGAVRLDRPTRTHKAALSYAPPSRPYGVDLAYKHVGALTQTVTGFGAQTYGDYYVANLGAHVLLDEQGRHRLGLRVENLFAWARLASRTC
jgi:vitamin B12 transporter